MLEEQTTEPPLEHLRPVAGHAELLAAIGAARRVHVEESVSRYVVALLRHTRASPRLALGASPRSGIALLRSPRLARSSSGGTTSCPRTSRRSPRAVLPHRLILAPEARSTGVTAEEVVAEALVARRPYRCEHARTVGARTQGGVGALAVAVLAAAWLFGSPALAVLGVGLGSPRSSARVWASARRPRAHRRAAGGRGAAGRRRHAPARASRCAGDVARLAPRARATRWARSVSSRRGSPRADGRARRPARAARPLRPRSGPSDGTRPARDHDGRGRRCPRRARCSFGRESPELGTLFTETGARGEGGRRAHVRLPSGLELHGVREYVEGEPLRAVHWPTSARRGTLMVRELEDAPRDSVAIVLDVERRRSPGRRAARASTRPCERLQGSSVRTRPARGERSS